VGEGADSPKQGTELPREREYASVRTKPTKSAVFGRLAIGTLAALAIAGPAAAGTIVVTLALVPGKLKVATIRASPTRIAFTVADGRGTGAGWTLRASAAVTVSAITARCVAHSTCTLPTAIAAPKGRELLTAAKGTGMGVMTVIITLKAPSRAGTSFSASVLKKKSH
jgi:hypothetical protein